MLMRKPKAKPPSGDPIKVENRIGVQAPAEVIWEILSDIDGWPRWNPTYPEARGTLRIGAPLQLVEALPGLPRRELNVNVIDWVPETQILWGERQPLGLVSTVRFIEIETVAKAACIFSNGVQVDGMLADLYLHKHRRPLRLGFAAMSEALKEMSEALWRDRSGGAT